MMWKAKSYNPLSSVRQCWGRLRDQAGQTLAEYAMILSLIAVVLVVTAVLVFRDGVVNAFSDARSCITGGCSQTPPHCNDGNGDDSNQVPCT